jgi:hypothetical protein
MADQTIMHTTDAIWVQAVMAPRLADGQGRFALHQMRKVDRSLIRRIGAGVAPWVVCWAMMASWMC